MSDTRFKKGFTPWNKGIKTGLKPTNGFKKGFSPWHTRELYSERVDKNGYILIKIDKLNKWVRKHRWLYEQEHGAIPENGIIIFADGNKNNLNIDNLLCVTRNELKVLNKCRLISSVAKLTKTGLNVAKLKIKLAEIRKGKKNEYKGI